MTDPSGVPEPAAQEQPAYSELAERPDPVYPKDLSKAMLLAALFGPLGLFYTAPGPAFLLLAAVFAATLVNVENAEPAWLISTAVSIVYPHYTVTKHNSKATVRGGKTE